MMISYDFFTIVQICFWFALLRFSWLDRNPVLRYESNALQLYRFADFMYDSSSFCFVCNGLLKVFSDDPRIIPRKWLFCLPYTVAFFHDISLDGSILVQYFG